MPPGNSFYSQKNSGTGSSIKYLIFLSSYLAVITVYTLGGTVEIISYFCLWSQMAVPISLFYSLSSFYLSAPWEKAKSLFLFIYLYFLILCISFPFFLSCPTSPRFYFFLPQIGKEGNTTNVTEGKKIINDLSIHSKEIHIF